MQALRIVFQAGLVVALGTFVRLPSALSHSVPMRAASLDEPSGDSPPVPRSARTDALVLVVLDGARWQEVLVATDAGFASGADRHVAASALMPTLHRMIADGAVVGAPGHGAPMLASGPHFISLPGYNEIFSGRRPRACADNSCPATRLPTFVDEVRARSSDVAVFASWAPIERAAALHPEEIVTSTGEAGTRAFRPDRATADAAFAYLVERRPTLLFLGLGEPDEFAHRSDYAGYLGALRGADGVLAELRARLAAMGEWGRRVTVFVTCDHGRAYDFRDHGAPWPESSRVWLVASGGAVPARGAVFSVASRRLSDIAPTARALLGLPAAASADSGAAIADLLPTP